MCWCDPNKRTPCCGGPNCHPPGLPEPKRFPPTPPVTPPHQSANARAEYWKAEHNAANVRIAELEARVSKLSNLCVRATAEGWTPMDVIRELSK